ncbi:phage tail family protein [Microbacterium halophytorum]|uniref:hypothetical protein n=1 Tax=Microbacterium halophytorum TaxID=2067568 RepID=UPI001319DF0F|nr:hypothetical protein [Microbacterium halophytorum]
MHFSGGPFDFTPGIYVREAEGFLGGGAVSAEDIFAMRRPGLVRTRNRRDAAREPALEGFIYAPTPSMLGTLIDSLQRILPGDDDLGWLSWTEFGRPWRRALVKRNGAVQIVRRGSTGFADFTIEFRADDQRVYAGDEEQTAWASTVTINHYGTYPAPVVIRVRGVHTGGYTITGPGGRVDVTRDLVDGVWHKYDADTGIFYVAGTPVNQGVARRDPLELPPGQHTFATSAGELQVTYSETYLP